MSYRFTSEKDRAFLAKFNALPIEDPPQEDQAPQAVRAKNTGKAFEQMVLDSAATYEKRGLLMLRKVDPPTRVLYINGQPKIIFLKNPYPDAVGVWTERGGCALFIEVKSSSELRLPICVDKGSGLTRDQYYNLIYWERAGAAVCVLWALPGGMRFVSLEAVKAARRQDRKSLKPEELPVIGQGDGFCLCDFLPHLRSLYPE